MLATNNTTPIHEVPTNFILSLTQPIQGADRPGGLQAYAMANQR